MKDWLYHVLMIFAGGVIVAACGLLLWTLMVGE